MQDIVGGTVLVATGALALYLCADLPGAAGASFGSGTAPRITAWAVIALGAFIAIVGWLTEGPAIEGFTWRGVICILGAVLLFALAIEPLGLIASGIPVMLLAARAASEFRWKEALAFAIGMTLSCVLLFSYGLAQPIPLLPTRWPDLPFFALVGLGAAGGALALSRRNSGKHGSR